MRKILVTGGAGFIGSHVAKELKQNGYEVIIFDNLISVTANTVERYGKLIVGDLRNLSAIEQLFQSYSFDAVMHFASFIEVEESVKDPGKYYHNNMVAMLNLLEMMRKYQVNKLIFSSTAAVYGTPIYTPIDEQHPLDPINPYGKSKLYIEQILLDYSKAYDFKYVSLRYFNAAGADLDGELGENHEPETHLIPLIAQSALKKRGQISIYGQDYNTPDGSCIRDYIHVSDLALAHVAALKYLAKNGSNIYNLGSGKGYSVIEIINTAKQILKTDFQNRYKLEVLTSERRAGDPDILVASAQKAWHDLKWKSSLGLREIIRSAIQWELIKNGTANN